MVDSGDTVVLEPGLAGPTVDKHSTGGVADGVTLVFAPARGRARARGRQALRPRAGPHGRDPGQARVDPGPADRPRAGGLRRQVAEVGCAVAAQSPNLVPADGALYALRDATATVPSIPLIAASVMSKKLAVATDLILLDVKAGSGAFMKTPEDAARSRDRVPRARRRMGRGPPGPP